MTLVYKNNLLMVRYNNKMYSIEDFNYGCILSDLVNIFYENTI